MQDGKEKWAAARGSFGRLVASWPMVASGGCLRGDSHRQKWQGRVPSFSPAPAQTSGRRSVFDSI